MKYVIINEIGLELPVLCDPIIDHSSIVYQKKVVAAGFFSLRTNGISVAVTCWGESRILNAKSRGEEDAEIILKSLDN